MRFLHIIGLLFFSVELVFCSTTEVTTTSITTPITSTVCPDFATSCFVYHDSAEYTWTVTSVPASETSSFFEQASESGWNFITSGQLVTVTIGDLTTSISCCDYFATTVRGFGPNTPYLGEICDYPAFIATQTISEAVTTITQICFDEEPQPIAVRATAVSATSASTTPIETFTYLEIIPAKLPSQPATTTTSKDIPPSSGSPTLKPPSFTSASSTPPQPPSSIDPTTTPSTPTTTSSYTTQAQSPSSSYTPTTPLPPSSYNLSTSLPSSPSSPPASSIYSPSKALSSKSLATSQPVISYSTSSELPRPTSYISAAKQLGSLDLKVFMIISWTAVAFTLGFILL